VFALLGVRYADLGMKADYSKPREVIFTEVTGALIKYKGLNILSCCLYPKKQQNLPT
jgi:hypothetical protein